MKSHFTPAPVGKKTLRSHFISGAAIACAVTGAMASLMANHAAAQAYDGASTYGSWTTGSTGGSGFGAWSFDQTQNPDNSFATSGQQGLSSAQSIGTAWTLFNLSSSGGLANAGRAITVGGGLLVGQTFETVIQNPSTYTGSLYYGGYRGWDILFGNATDNNAPGDNTSAIRASVFNYFNPSQNWAINDPSKHTTSLTGPTTAAQGVRIDLTLTSATAYSLTMTPLNGATPYTLNSTYTGPINYVDFRLYNAASSGLNDTADNFEISSMTIQGLLLNIQLAGANAVLSWPTNALGVNLASSLNLGVGAAWSTNGLPSPVVINNLNFVTNPIAGTQQYYRLQQ